MKSSNDKEQAAYDKLKRQIIGAESYVAVSQLLDILEKRATLCLRAIARPNLDIPTTNFARGQYAEMQSLQEALNDLK